MESNNLKKLCERINPLFQDIPEETDQIHLADKKLPQVNRQRSPASGEKSSSSGYGGSHVEPLYLEQLKHRDETGVVLEQNPAFVKSIKVTCRQPRNNKSVPSFGSGSSGGGTLTTIPEGKVDPSIPKPIWPYDNRKRLEYDSLVDDALLLYTSLNYAPDGTKCLESYIDLSVKDLLVELLNSINSTLEGNTGMTPENMLRMVNEKISMKLEALKNSTEDEMRKLCVNLSKCKKVNSVLRAFSNSSSSGNSSQSSPEWNNGRVRTFSSETEDIYHIPSGSSSSGFSDSVKDQTNVLPVFVHEDIASVPNGIRNVMIYGTLHKARVISTGDKLVDKCKTGSTVPKKSLLRAVNDNKPSVWEQYYGMKATDEGQAKCGGKPTDVPLYPGGRPEADFTLDVPRSELLSKKMRDDKKWRCRCRLLTSFLGLVFFLLSVMAVSLMLTRGKRMFGSMA